jgi:hypothetical protein
LKIVKDNTEQYPMNNTISDKIFENKSNLIDYFIKITNTLNMVSPNYENRTLTMYDYLPFQEYIDYFFQFNNSTNWNIEKDYKKYISNITKNRGEYDKIVEKHKQDAKRRTLKNHILYIIYLLICQDTNPSYLFTDENNQDMDIYYDFNDEYFIEYFISKGFSFRDYFMENGNITDQIENPKDYIEYSVFQEIKLAYQEHINDAFDF